MDVDVELDADADGDESAAADGVMTTVDTVVDVMNVVRVKDVELKSRLELEPAVETSSVLTKTESCAEVLDAAPVFVFEPPMLVLVPVLAPGNVTEMPDGKILNVRMPVLDVESAAAVESASAIAEVVNVIGTIGGRDEGASEPVIVVIEGLTDAV